MLSMSDSQISTTSVSSTSASSYRKNPPHKCKSEANQVRYTGDWSSDSKLSAIHNGYWEDPFFRFFNTADPSKVRRTSLICRGYYVRFRVCDYFLRRILKEIGKPVQIVSLGAGMDTTYFRILPELETSILRFYELDFKSVITAKKSIILHNEILQVMAGDKLRLLHCDLRQISSLEEALKKGHFDFQKPTLFFSECVVNYLRPHENVSILEWITENVPNSIWLAYEQCNASDSFGQIMVSHFLKNGCPLLSLLSAQNLEDQETQLRNANFDEAKVMNAWDAFLKIGADNPPYFPPVNKNSQQFDEYEQLLATCLHYSLRIGVKGRKFVQCRKFWDFLDEFNNSSTELSKQCKREMLALPQSSFFKVKSFPLSCLPKLTGHKAVVTAKGTILTFGGSGENSRRMKHLIASDVDFSSEPETPTLVDAEDDNEYDSVWESNLRELSVNSRILSENPKLYERLHSSAVLVPSSLREGESFDSVLIFGGRKSPMDPCGNDLIELNLETSQMSGDIGSVILSSVYGRCPPPRWRHAMTLCSKDSSPHLLLFGGKTTDAVLGDMWWYSIEDFSWKEREKSCSSQELGKTEPGPRHSHSMVSGEDNVVYMIGGMSESDASLCQDAFWTFDPTTDKWTYVDEFNYFARRIGHIAIKHKNNLIILGGYGADSSYNLDFFAVVIDLELRVVRPISHGMPKDELFLPFGFSAVIVQDGKDDCSKIIVFGGGGNLFSFGTYYNEVCFMITLDEENEDKSSSV